MKKAGTAWLITHDAYIDRRILFFADVLIEKGYAVTLFPAAYTDFTNDQDPEYVVRPLDWSVVKLYALRLDALQAKERELLESIIAAQSQYHQVNGRYAANISVLQQEVRGKNAGYTLLTQGERSGYWAGIGKGDRYLVYDSHTQRVTVIASRAVALEAREYERAIVDVDLNVIAREGHALYGDIAVAYTRGPKGKALAAHCKAADDGVWAFQNEPPELYRGTPIPYSGLCVDELGGKRFDYREYRKIVYDFSPILEQVRRALQKERPDLVYVADLPTLPIGVMLKEVTGCTLMIDCHEWWYKQARLWESSMEQKIALSEKSEAELYPKCDVCITVGRYLAQDMSQCYGKHFDVIYSCMSANLSLDSVEPTPGFWLAYGIPLEARVAIFQGSMTALRNLDNLARATRWLEDDCYLVVVGGGPYEETFLHILQQEGRPDRVVMVGWVNQSDLLKYTVNADLGVLPYSAMDEYFSYSVPNKLMEYFEASLPMLYDISMKEISMVAGEHGVGIAEDLSDPEKFGITLNALLHDSQRIAALKANYTGCKNKFSFESQRAAFVEILEENGL